MIRTPQQLRDDARMIWDAAVTAVDSARLVREAIQLDGPRLEIAGELVELAADSRVIVVGAGKAGAGMAAGVEQALAPLIEAGRLSGWLNVPADCVRSLRAIQLHAARPAGVNEPMAEGVHGSAQILARVAAAGANDLCLCLISGGGSALLPAPVEGITLADKQALTRHLSAAGANIAELNTVRKQLSRIKGGGLARACRAGRLIALVISDVLGDPLDVIASGPTVDDTATAADALAVLEKFQAREGGVPSSVFKYLESQINQPQAAITIDVATIVIGNNALAVDAAGIVAERLGYSHAMHSSPVLEGPAEEIGRHLARMARQMRATKGPDCLITGGEPTVKLAPTKVRGRGGRNQQLVLAALDELVTDAAASNAAADGVDIDSSAARDIVILSGGTDGEDGPTDAAGALIDADGIAVAAQLGLDPQDYLRRNDAYTFFDATSALLRTGPTHTNVCDVRVVVVNQRVE